MESQRLIEICVRVKKVNVEKIWRIKAQWYFTWQMQMSWIVNMALVANKELI